MRGVSMLMSATLLGGTLCAAAQTLPGRMVRQERSREWETCHTYLGQAPAIIVSACSKLIDSGTEAKEDLESAYLARGEAYTAQAEYKQALADFHQALQLDPYSWRVLLSEGRAYRDSGSFDKAIDSLSQALEFGKEANATTMLEARAKTYWMAGEDGNAERDFDRLIEGYAKADPKNIMLSEAYRSRGLFYLSTGRFSSAEADFASATAFNSGWTEQAETDSLYQYLAAIKARKDGTPILEAAAKKYGLTKWPGPLVKFCLGQAKAADVVAAIDDKFAMEAKRQRAEAYFFLGEIASVQGSTAEATSWLQRARDEDYVSSDAYVTAGLELKSLAAIRGLVPTPVTVASLPNGKYYALVIGIDHYPAPMNELKTAVRDAEAMARLLREKYGFEVTSLLDKEATHDNILDAITRYQDTLGPNDNLLIYYAGHGHGVRNAAGTYEKAYWLPVDATSERSSRRIIADDLTTDIQELPARHVLVISDSCYAGGLTRSAKNALRPSMQPAYLAKMLAGRSRTLMASGGEEPVADEGPGGHSVFAAAVLRALEREDGPMFTANQMFVEEVQPPVAGNARQIPQYSFIRDSGHDNGDFVFVRRR